MKNNSLTAILLGVLALSVLASLVLTMLFSSNVRELRQLQAQVGVVNNNRAVAAQMVNELLEHSRKNPALDPLLESAGLKQRTAPGAMPKQGGK